MSRPPRQQGTSPQAAAAGEDYQPTDENAWIRIATRVSLIFSLVLSAIFLLTPVWDTPNVLDDAFGYLADFDAFILLALLIVVAIIWDLVAIVLSLANLRKPHRRPNLIMAVVALLVVIAPVAVSVIWSSVETNGW
jgi:amino acid transporter